MIGGGPIAFRALRDLSQKVNGVREDLAQAEADRAALRGQIAEIERTWAWRLHKTLASVATRPKQVD